VEYELIRTKRKTIAIYIREHGVEVRAPKWATVSDIDAFVVSKIRWIGKHLEEQAKSNLRKSAFRLDYGSVVQYMGREYVIGSVPGENIIYVPPGLDRDRLLKKIIAFYKEEARRHINERVLYFDNLLNASPYSVRIGSAKRSWGSCTSPGRLAFSWRLMMAPPEAIDYVVAHELAHLKQMNHSPKFWAVVGSVLPDWKERRKTLRLLQKRLENEKWD